MSAFRPLALGTTLALLAGCATVPQPLQGNYAPVSTVSAQQGGAGGTPIRWGGEIIKTEPGPSQTCFFLLRHKLDEQARPERSRDSDNLGRFVACHAGFYDPEVFTRGRELTVTGTLHGIVSKKVGDYDYAYPRVEAKVVYLWPRPRVVNRPYPSAFYDPFWGPGYGGWGGYGPFGYGGYGSPFGYQPRIIVIPRGGHGDHDHDRGGKR